MFLSAASQVKLPGRGMGWVKLCSSAVLLPMSLLAHCFETSSRHKCALSLLAFRPAWDFSCLMSHISEVSTMSNNLYPKCFVRHCTKRSYTGGRVSWNSPELKLWKVSRLWKAQIVTCSSRNSKIWMLTGIETKCNFNICLNLSNLCEVRPVVTLVARRVIASILLWSAIKNGLNSLYSLIERALLFHLNCVLSFFFSPCLASERIMIPASQMEC